jgi:hypothetical protein
MSILKLFKLNLLINIRSRKFFTKFYSNLLLSEIYKLIDSRLFLDLKAFKIKPI